MLVLEGLLRAAYGIRNHFVDAVPLPYDVDADYGPTPPWNVERATGENALIVEDSILMWRGKPGVERRYIDVFGPFQDQRELRSMRHDFLPRRSMRGTVWSVRTNSEGFRERELPPSKPEGVIRIICLGDSWTLGTNVDQELSYPRQLERLLKTRYPGRRFEVYNLGVMGYTSYHGMRLLERRALALQPDVVVLAFAMNELQLNGKNPTLEQVQEWWETYGRKKSGFRPEAGHSFAMEHVELYRLLRYWALYLKWEPGPYRQRLGSMVGAHQWYRRDRGKSPEETEEWLQQSLETYRGNYLRMIRLTREHGASPILLYNEFWYDSPFVEVLRRLASSEGVPLVDAGALIKEEKGRIDAERERRKNLVPPPAEARQIGENVEFVFRVDAAHVGVPERIYVAYTDSSARALAPNRVAMHDDGTHGDQRAGDRVWSYSVPAPAGASFAYLYTNSGRPGAWENLELPAIRYAEIPDEPPSIVYGPVDRFGVLTLHADPWHTDSMGYRLIAEAVFALIGGSGEYRR